MFTSFLEWRKANQADDAMAIFKCPNVPKAKKIYKHGYNNVFNSLFFMLLYHGTDREGHPFYIDQPCQFHVEDILKIVSREEVIQYFIREYEYLLHVRLPACSTAFGKKIEKTFAILNIGGFTMSMFKEKSREFVKIPIGITQNNYPEVMYKLFIINAPFIFKGVWAVIKPFLAERSRQKISILGTKYHKELFEHVDPDNVPESLGGKCTCAELGGDCFSSNKGPWLEYPGDSIGEAAKKQLSEEEKKEEFDPFLIEEAEEVNVQLQDKLILVEVNSPHLDHPEGSNGPVGIDEQTEAVQA